MSLNIGEHWHNHQSFLQTNDNTSLVFPEGFLETQTEEMQKWWNIKQEHWPTVLLLKDGDVFNMHHMDADIAMKYIANKDNMLNYNAGEYACVSIEKDAYGKVSETLVKNGFQVARVEKLSTDTTSNPEKTKAIEKMLHDMVVKEAKKAFYTQESKI